MSHQQGSTYRSQFCVQTSGATSLDAVRMTINSDQLLLAQQRAARSQALDGYVRHLSEVTARTKDQAAVLELRAARDRATAKVAEIEKTLAAEQERARKAADAARMLTGLSAAFSLASSIAAANASTGLDLESLAGGKIPTKEALTGLLNRLSDSAGAKVKGLAVEQETLRDDLTNTETRLFTLGVKYQMDPKESSVFKQRTP